MRLCTHIHSSAHTNVLTCVRATPSNATLQKEGNRNWAVTQVNTNLGQAGRQTEAEKCDEQIADKPKREGTFVPVILGRKAKAISARR